MSLISYFRNLLVPAQSTGTNKSSSQVRVRTKYHVVESWLLLVYIELIMRFRSAQTLRATVHRQSVRHVLRKNTVNYEALSHAVDLACVFYWKRVFCLQRSAATTILLRKYGWKAEMVTGVQMLPAEFHAWVEIGDLIVNDRPYMHEIYQVLERC